MSTKIYEIYSEKYNKRFFSYTKKSLEEKLSEVKKLYKRYKQTNKKYIPVFDIMDDEECTINLIKESDDSIRNILYEINNLKKGNKRKFLNESLKLDFS